MYKFYLCFFISFALVYWVDTVRTKKRYKAYLKYAPPQNEMGKLIKTIGIVTKVSHYSDSIYKYNKYNYSYDLIRIEYKVNEVGYKKNVFLPGAAKYYYLRIMYNEVNLLYDNERPEISYLDINTEDIEKTIKKENKHFLLEMIIGLVIIAIIYIFFVLYLGI